MNFMNFRKKSLIAALILCFLLSGAIAQGTENKETRSDTWLKAKLVTSYTLNEHLNPFKIDVEVTDGVATITGEVDSEIERDLAVEIARGIEGVKKVEENLVIEPREKPRKENEFARRVDDATTTAKVKYRLMLNRNTEGIGIDVDTENNVVTLTGEVDSDEQKELVLKLAQNTTGVTEVKDKLKVAAAKEMKKEDNGSSLEMKMRELSGDIKDTWITTKAKSVLLISSEADGADYDVSTEKAEITVTGKVLSEKQKAEVGQILKDLQGVKKVTNKLEIR